jgi:MOSC domain-containing protein YiiM
MRSCESLRLIEGVGVEGDRYATESGFYSNLPHPGRQVTLFEMETLEAMARDYKITLAPHEHRRNITTRGVPLNHLVGVRFRIGKVLLVGHQLSVPCRHIEQLTGKEVFNAMVHRSGLLARILSSGDVHVGDEIRLAEKDAANGHL